MTPPNKVAIRRLPTGVPGLDQILGGGFPEFSLNLIAGAPGCGKTTLAHQFIFANATPEYPALYFTVLGEPALKMLRYQQQYTFFDHSQVNRSVRFVNLSDTLLKGGMQEVLQEITKQVKTAQPRLVVVDSFRTVLHQVWQDDLEIQEFVQHLGLLLASWEVTSFLISEYAESEMHQNPVFTVADGLVWLYQTVERNAVVRQLQVVKLRGQRSVPGLHTFRITDDGLQAFSRTLGLTARTRTVPSEKRLSMGVPELDEMLGGGIPEGDSLLIAGSSGTGKSLLATQFIAAGIRAGEPGIVMVFEERPEEYVGRAGSFGLDLSQPLHDGTLQVIYLRPLDLSVDETLQEVLQAIEKTGAKRLVIDSLAGFEVALAPGFRADFRESLYRMIFSLTGIGITVLSTVEVEESFTELLFSSYSVSFLTDDIIRLRYVEIDGQLRLVLIVVKMRGGAHSRDIREYEITAQGIALGERLRNYECLLTGMPRRVEGSTRPPPASRMSAEEPMGKADD